MGSLFFYRYVSIIWNLLSCYLVFAVYHLKKRSFYVLMPIIVVEDLPSFLLLRLCTKEVNHHDDTKA